MMGQLSNCSRCGGLVVIGPAGNNICPSCIKEIEQEFVRCAQFLRKKENRNSNMIEMSEATGVSVAQITAFIQQKRLFVADFPQMGYPCEGCGNRIQSGRLCSTCATSWNAAFAGETGGSQKKNQKQEGFGYYIKEKDQK